MSAANTHNDVLMLSVSGCRGIVGTSLTPETVSRFAGALGTYLVDRHASAKVKGPVVVVVGRDGRAGGAMIADAAIASLNAAGVHVVDTQVAMTPTIGTTVDALGAAGGLVITASHNPQQWNGLKPIIPSKPRPARAKVAADGLLELTVPRASARLGKADASAPNKALADTLIKAFHDGAARRVGWKDIGSRTVGDLEAMRSHHELALEAIDNLGILRAIQKKRFGVVLDSVNSSGRELTPNFLISELRCKATLLHCDDSGLFPHTPEPLAENLKGLAASVRKHKAHAGFAQDPDADRLALIDEKGRYIGEEYTVVLAARALAELGALKPRSTLVVNLSTSRMIEDVAAAFGCRVRRSAVGEANVVETMKSLGSPIGGEGNGGVIWPAVTYIRDSMSAMGLILGLMAKTGKTLSTLADEVPVYAIVKRKVEVASRDVATRAVEKLAAHYKAAPGVTVDRQDGVWLGFEQQRAWLHVRASNTEPIMRLIAEAPTAADANRLLDQAAGIIA
ncbi:MAG: phosphoglucosamine mutase [Phycisphaerales bacterium]|jgi:phosphomannomutase|nr:hypothetical protein [Phycisphaeraceae bacterium]